MSVFLYTDWIVTVIYMCWNLMASKHNNGCMKRWEVRMSLHTNPPCAFSTLHSTTRSHCAEHTRTGLSHLCTCARHAWAHMLGDGLRAGAASTLICPHHLSLATPPWTWVNTQKGSMSLRTSPRSFRQHEHHLFRFAFSLFSDLDDPAHLEAATSGVHPHSRLRLTNSWERETDRGRGLEFTFRLRCESAGSGPCACGSLCDECKCKLWCDNEGRGCGLIGPG